MYESEKKPPMVFWVIWSVINLILVSATSHRQPKPFSAVPTFALPHTQTYMRFTVSHTYVCTSYTFCGVCLNCFAIYVGNYRINLKTVPFFGSCCFFHKTSACSYNMYCVVLCCVVCCNIVQNIVVVSHHIAYAEINMLTNKLYCKKTNNNNDNNYKKHQQVKQ